MDTKQLYTQYIKNNVPLLLLGKSGTGKSEIIKQIASELNMPIVDLRLSQLPPEDLNGLPAPTADGKAFHYLLPQWFNAFQPDTPFILFLDEMNQASSHTINALYAIVHDRMIAGKYNPNMRVVGAGNLLEESDFLNEIPQPLLNRFVVKQHKAKAKEVIGYLTSKYTDNEKALRVLNAVSEYDWLKSMNPRALERTVRNLCVLGIKDKEEIDSQTNDKGLTQLILDSFGGKTGLEGETATEALVRRAREGTATDIKKEIEELINEK